MLIQVKKEKAFSKARKILTACTTKFVLEQFSHHSQLQCLLNCKRNSMTALKEKVSKRLRIRGYREINFIPFTFDDVIKRMIVKELFVKIPFWVMFPVAMKKNNKRNFKFKTNILCLPFVHVRTGICFSINLYPIVYEYENFHISDQ